MPHAPGLPQALLLLAAAVLVAVAFRRMKLSPVLGYLLAGAALGPAGARVVTEPEQVEAIAELGIVFLLFSIGLELSLARMWQLRRMVFGLGGAQMAVTGALIVAAAMTLGAPWTAAVVLGGGLALSSTAMVLRLLEERRETSTRTGRAAVSVLLFQDLAVVPLLALVPLLGGEGGGAAGALGVAVGKALLAVGVIVFVGRIVVRPVLHVVAAARSPEVFTGTTLLIALGVGWLTGLAGLSMALGAFLAGLVIAETEFRHQVEGDIEPFRGLLLALFFVAVGLGLDVSLLVREAPLLLGLALALAAGKALVLAPLALAFGMRRGEAAQVGLTLAQGSEFGFVLFALAAAAGALPAALGGRAEVVVALSMALTPLWMALGRRLAARFPAPSPASADASAISEELAGHVLIAGFGRVGQTLARMLEERGLPYLALDLDRGRVAAARRRGLPVYFGDASRAEVLRAAGLSRAAAAVVTLDDARAAEHAVAVIHGHDRDLPVLVRARDTSRVAPLEEAGARVVVPELVEGSLELGERLLTQMGDAREEARRLADLFRADDYARLDAIVPPGDGDAGDEAREAGG